MRLRRLNVLALNLGAVHASYSQPHGKEPNTGLLLCLAFL